MLSPALAHYDPATPIRPPYNALPYEVDAVISHMESDGQERPVPFALRSLTKAERGYAQIKRHLP